jgi:hypothetical protein
MNKNTTHSNPSFKSTTRRLFPALGLALALGLAACGASDSSLDGATDAGDPAVIADDPSAPVDDGLPTEPAPEPPDVVAFADMEGTLIGSANMGGEVLDPKPAEIDGFDIMESAPEQIAISFTAGAEGCTAATAQAFATETQVIIALEVGITTDALSKSCMSGEFEHRLTIGLEEGLGGREVVVVQR